MLYIIYLEVVDAEESEMILYHGSDVVVNTPKILPSQRFLDFGILYNNG